jgi:hypothetical protein
VELGAPRSQRLAQRKGAFPERGAVTAPEAHGRTNGLYGRAHSSWHSALPFCDTVPASCDVPLSNCVTVPANYNAAPSNCVTALSGGHRNLPNCDAPLWTGVSQFARAVPQFEGTVT